MTAIASRDLALSTLSVDAALVRASFALACDRAPDLAGRVLERVHAACPEVREVLRGLSVEAQEAALEAALQAGLASLDDAAAFAGVVAGFAAALAPFALPAKAYGELGLALVETVEAMEPDLFTLARKRAIIRAWRAVAVGLRA